MAFPVRVSYRDVEPSETLERLAQTEAAKLERFFDGIVSCRVLIEHAHRRHHEGSPFNVRIELNVPGKDLSVNHVPDVHAQLVGNETIQVHKTADVDAANKDPTIAIRGAFKKMRRQLQNYARRLAF